MEEEYNNKERSFCLEVVCVNYALRHYTHSKTYLCKGYEGQPITQGYYYLENDSGEIAHVFVGKGSTFMAKTEWLYKKRKIELEKLGV